MRQITNDMVTAWYNTYVRNKYDDPHEAFAKAIGVCHEIIYTIGSSRVMHDYVVGHYV